MLVPPSSPHAPSPARFSRPRLGLLRSALWASLLAGVGLSGCIDSEPGAAHAPDSGLTTADLDEGWVGPLAVPSPTGVRHVYAQQVGDRYLAEGDIDVTDEAERYLAGERNFVVTDNTAWRWPGGVVPYEKPDHPDLNVELIQKGIDRIESRTPIRFVVRKGESDYIRFVPASGSSAKVGRRGGRQDIKLARPTDKHAGADLRTVMHELYHALGVWHEHSRPDRDDYITYHQECVANRNKRHNFDTHDDVITLGPFDFSSIMLYSSWGFSAEEDGCPTLTTKNGDTWDRPTVLSERDINGMHLLYGKRVGKSESHDKFGYAVASGDFDGDGFLDVAVGAPQEQLGDADNTGAVYLFKGTDAGLAPWKRLGQTDRIVGGGSDIGDQEPDDRFGWSLAAGDFDGDGVDDLAIGAPYEDLGGESDVGAVYIYRGYKFNNPARTGLFAAMRIHQERQGFGNGSRGDRFGTALAVGDFNGDGRDDLAMGAPYRDGKTTDDIGRVFLMRGKTGALLEKWKSFSESVHQPVADNTRFGFTLSAGDYDNDGKDDLAVAAIGSENGVSRGAVYIFDGASTTADKRYRLSNKDGYYFGGVLASGDFNGDGKVDLAVKDSGLIRLYRSATVRSPWVYAGDFNSQTHFGTGHHDDHFGWSMAAGDIDGDGSDDLVVGAPRELVNGERGGAVYVMRGGYWFLTPWKRLTQSRAGGPEIDDRLGHALTMGDYDGDGIVEIAAGAPTEKLDSKVSGLKNRPEAGVVSIFDPKGKVGAVTGFSNDQSLSQEVKPLFAN